MSSNNRPWYKWYPKDFVSDEKVQTLSPIAELVYRRALDVMWQANACQLPSNCLKLANALSKGIDENEFQKAWEEIQFAGFELFKTTDDGNWIYSKRLKEQMDSFDKLSKTRSKLGKKGGLAKAKAKAKQKQSNGQAIANDLLKQNLSDTDTDTDIKDTSKEVSETPPTKPPNRPPKKKPAPQAPSASKHFSIKVGDQLEKIKRHCIEIERRCKANGKVFNPWQWVTQKSNINGHPLAISQSLEFLLLQWDEVEKPWAFVDKTFITKNPRFNERQELTDSQTFKTDKQTASKEFQDLWAEAMRRFGGMEKGG